jgi:hypothetical protein
MFMVQSKEEYNAYHRRYHQLHKEKRNAERRAYYQTHKEQTNERGREYYKMHKEELKAKRSKYYQLHKERTNAKCREYYRLHKEQAKNYSIEWRNNHRERYRERGREYYKTHRKQVDDCWKRIYGNRKDDYIKLLGSKCQMCGREATSENYCAFDFHHKDRRTKDRTGEWRRRDFRDKILRGEIMLLCAFCHRMIDTKTGVVRVAWQTSNLKSRMELLKSQLQRVSQ